MALKRINEVFTLNFTVEELAEYNRLIDKNTSLDGIRGGSSATFNRCGRCGRDGLTRDDYYCPTCGQAFRFIDHADTAPDADVDTESDADAETVVDEEKTDDDGLMPL